MHTKEAKKSKKEELVDKRKDGLTLNVIPAVHVLQKSMQNEHVYRSAEGVRYDHRSTPTILLFL
jgi:hypothetical protein